MVGYQYLRPRSVDEAIELVVKQPAARLIAGGTDLMVRLHQRAERPPTLVSLRAIPELCGISYSNETTIGALTPIADIVASSEIAVRYPVLVAACRTLGSPQVRNVATIGGNLCNGSPCADTAPPLLVLDARLRLAGPRGTREVPIDQFFTGPGATCRAPDEVMTAVVLAAPRPTARAVFMKKTRVCMDLALVSAAVLLELDGNRCGRARIALGSVAPTPLRLRPVEQLLEGAAVDRDLLQRAQALTSASVAPIDDVRASAAFRREIAGVFVRRAIEQLLGWSQP